MGSGEEEAFIYTYFLCSDLGGDALPAYISDISALYIIIVKIWDSPGCKPEAYNNCT